MDDKIKTFLNSGLLEEYMMGLCSEEDIKHVESYIQDFPEVRSAYNQLQNDVEKFADKYRASMPESLKQRIIQKTSPSSSPSPISVWNKWSSLAAGLALAFLCSTLLLFYQKKDLEKERLDIQAAFAQLEAECQEKQGLFAELQQEHAILSHHLTQKVSLSGKGLGDGMAGTAYWNKKAEASFVKFQKMPKAPDAHCFQLWADVDGKMVNMGVLPQSEDRLLPLPFKTNANSINITVEPSGGSEHPTVSRIVASVKI